MKEILIGLVLSLVFLPFSACAEIYYVDATNGTDTWSGNYPNPQGSPPTDGPWKTISKVNSWSFSPGDTINFKRGETWSGTELHCDNSGNSFNWITYQDYGYGNMPIIKNPGSSLQRSIKISGDYIKLRYLDIQDNHEGCVWITPDSDYSIVEYCEMSNGGSGIHQQGTNGIFRHNYIHDLTMVVNTVGGDDDYGATGIWFFNSYNEAHHNIIENCVQDSYDYVKDGGAFEIFETFSPMSNISVHHNWCYNCAGLMETRGGYNLIDVKIYYNVFVDGWSTAFYAKPPVSNFQVYNNVFIDTITTSDYSYVGFGAGGSPEFKFRNNIFYIGPWTYVCNSNGEGWAWTHENNCYYGDYKNLGFPLGTGEMESDPKFVNLLGDDFNLQSDSPCIDNGTDVGLTLDFEGNPVPYGPLPDIGAYEYGSQPANCNGTCRPNPCDTYDDCANASGECSFGYHCCSGIACIHCGDTYCDQGENCSSCPSDCDCSLPEICCNDLCTTPACFNESDCGSDPCKDYVCSNPGDCSASCSFQDKTSCENYDGCCPPGCNEGNDYDCGGPVALYHFDENSGNITGDSSGNGNDGTIHGATWTNGISGYALEFDGLDDYVEIDATGFPTKGPFTVIAWINKTNSWSTQAAVSRWSDNNIVFELQAKILGYEGGFNLNARTSDSSAFYATMDTAQLNEWYHLAGAADGNTASLYVNGVEYNGSDMGWNTGEPSGVVRIGMRPDGNYPFEGIIDEVRIYNRTLTEGEILELYNNPGGEQIPGDLNSDGSVDVLDLGIIAANFGKTSGYEPGADVVPNSEIDVFDLVYVASRFT